MKLHDNSRFEGVLVVPWTTANLLKFHRLIEVSGCPVGLPDFEEDRPGSLRQHSRQQVSRHSLAAEFRRHRQVQKLPFVFRHRARNQKSGDARATEGHPEVILQVFGNAPRGRLRTGFLDGRNLAQIACFAAADSCHIGLIMHVLLPLFFFFAQPFWEAKPPEKWSDSEIAMLRSNSPWAQVIGPEPGVLVYFATATPIEEAEGELRLRTKNTLREPDPDYLTYLSENRNKHFVLAIPYDKVNVLEKAEELRKMEAESAMVIGRKSYKIIGHFPPTPSDPVLRLVFPREVQATDKKVVFRLYVPGVEFPDREAEFQVRELLYRGKLEM
jgi:hypothetical protein